MLYIGNDIVWSVTSSDALYYRVRNKKDSALVYYGKANPKSGTVSVLLNDIVRPLFSTDILHADINDTTGAVTALNGTIINVVVEYSTTSTFSSYSTSSVYTIANAYPFFKNEVATISNDTNVKVYTDYTGLYGTSALSYSAFASKPYHSFDISVFFPSKFVYGVGSTYASNVNLYIDLYDDDDTLIESYDAYSGTGNLTATSLQASINLYELFDFAGANTSTKAQITVSGNYYDGSTTTATTFAITQIPLGYVGATTACVSPYTIFAINNLGQQVQLPLFGHYKRNRSYNKSTYKSDYQTDKVYKNEITETFELNTGWLTEDESNVFECVYSSNKLVLKDTTTNKIYNVQNTTNNWTEYKYLSDKTLKNITFTFDVQRKLVQQYD